ncbi:hypothetical protein F5Y18DRAFT_15601 [Xylariaceae sp. FL1019]|nr:hypothetical protein F5Y18DRAFT_15601 [Xylariaceae sp. FL1019]
MKLHNILIALASAWSVATSSTSTQAPTRQIVVPVPTSTPITTESITTTAIATTSTTASAVCATSCPEACSCGCACYPPTTSAAPARLTPSWSRFILIGSLALVIYLVTPVLSAFGLEWVSTAESRVQCGDAQTVGTLPKDFLAKADDCKKIADSYNSNLGYYQTQDWNDNKDNEFVILDGEGTCEFTIRHVNKNSKVDVMIGNEDITDFIDLALKYKDSNGMLAAGGLFGCTQAKDQDKNEQLEWRVWDPNWEEVGDPVFAGAHSFRPSLGQLFMVLAVGAGLLALFI